MSINTCLYYFYLFYHIQDLLIDKDYCWMMTEQGLAIAADGVIQRKPTVGTGFWCFDAV